MPNNDFAGFDQWEKVCRVPISAIGFRMVHEAQQSLSRRNPEAEYSPTAEELRCYELYASGEYSFREVGELIGLSHTSARNIFHRVNQHLVAQSMDRMREQREALYAHLIHLRREAMRAWRRSQQDAEQTTERKGKDGTETSRTVKGQVGDPRFLAEARACDQAIREMLGLDAATKFQMEGPADVGRVAGGDRTRKKLEAHLGVVMAHWTIEEVVEAFGEAQPEISGPPAAEIEGRSVGGAGGRADAGSPEGPGESGGTGDVPEVSGEPPGDA